MRMDWVPVSAALLLTGALAFCLGAFLMPRSDDAVDSLRIVQEQGGQWMTAAAILAIAAVCLSLGVPAILTLVQRRGWATGLLAAVVLEVGFIGTAAFALLMVFFHSLVVTGTVEAHGLDDVASETGLSVFFWIWIAGLYVGELLLAIALLRARTTPVWVPVVLLLHVFTLPLSTLLPEWPSKGTSLLLVLGFAGVAIHAASPENRRRLG